MAEHRIFKARFSDIYPLYVQKALRKGRTQDEVDAVILWLTGYTPGGLARQLAQRTDMASFFGQAPRFNPAGAEIKGVVCGVVGSNAEFRDPFGGKHCRAHGAHAGQPAG